MRHLPNAVGFGGNPGAMCGDFGGSRWEADWEYAVPVVGAVACASRFLCGCGCWSGGAQSDPFDVQIKPFCVHSICYKKSNLPGSNRRPQDDL